MIHQRPRRPRSVTILLAGVITIAGLALLRLAAAIQQWSFLSGLPGYSPFYIASSGMIWSAAGSALVWGLWRGAAWTPHLAKLLIPLYAAYYWFDRLILSNRQADRLVTLPVNAGFALLVTIVSLVYCYWALSREKSNIYFGDRHERTS